MQARRNPVDGRVGRQFAEDVPRRNSTADALWRRSGVPLEPHAADLRGRVAQDDEALRTRTADTVTGRRDRDRWTTTPGPALAGGGRRVYPRRGLRGRAGSPSTGSGCAVGGSIEGQRSEYADGTEAPDDAVIIVCGGEDGFPRPDPSRRAAPDADRPPPRRSLALSKHPPSVLRGAAILAAHLAELHD